jgi:hypothetical protein
VCLISKFETFTVSELTSQFVSDDPLTRAGNVQESLISNNIARAMNLVSGQTILIKLREENGQSPEEVEQSLPFR